MRRFGVSEEALGAPSASAEVRALVRYETDRGLAYLESGARLVSLLHGWARVAVGGYVAGGRAAAAAIRTADYDVLASDCSPSKRAVAMSYLRKRVWAPR
jgi:phytoene/squalene synthetase